MLLLKLGRKLCYHAVMLFQFDRKLKILSHSDQTIFFIIDNLINFLNPSHYKKLGCQFLTLGKKVYNIAIPKIICFMGFYVTTYF